VNSVERKNNINPREILYAVYLSKELKEKNSFLLKIKELISEDLFIEMTKRKEKILFDLDLMLDQAGDLKKIVIDMYTNLQLEKLDRERGVLRDSLRNMDLDTEKEKELMRKLRNISLEMEDLKKSGCKEISNMV